MVLPFLGNRALYAEAIAVQEAPVASFWVGSKLATTNSQTAPLCVLLRVVGANLLRILGIGILGLAGVKITPSGLFKQLGMPVGADMSVGEWNSLLAARKVELGQLLNAIVASLANQNSLLGLNASLLNSLTAKLGVDQLLVQLGSNSVANGLFAMIQASAGSALNVDLDALGLLTAAVGLGVSNHAVTVNLGLPAAVHSASGSRPTCAPASSSRRGWAAGGLDQGLYRPDPHLRQHRDRRRAGRGTAGPARHADQAAHRAGRGRAGHARRA